MTLTLHNTLIISFSLIGFSLLVSSIEILIAKTSLIHDEIAAWQIIKYRSHITQKGILGNFLDTISTQHNMNFLKALRALFGGLLLVTALMGHIYGILIIINFLLTLMILVRSPYGFEGSYQLQIIILCCLSIAMLFWIDKFIVHLALWFITFQILLAYFTAGAVKVVAKDWRSGIAIVNALSTKTFGNFAVADFLDNHRALAFIGCWIVIGFELFLPFAFIIGGPTLYVFLAIALLFHIGVAIVMGLHRFVPIFLSTYPIIVYCRQNWHFHL